MSFLPGILASDFFRNERYIPATMTAAEAVGICVLLIKTASGQGRDDAAAMKVFTGGAVISDSDAPRRLSDGGVFLPKPTQRLAEINVVLLKAELGKGSGEKK
jgi:cobalt-zinc-cadmium efflux system membrane fusion protein